MIGGAAHRAAERKLAVKAEVHIPMSAPAGLRSGALEEALGADVVGRALAEAAAAQRQKKAERAGVRAREAVMDPRGAAKRRRK